MARALMQAAHGLTKLEVLVRFHSLGAFTSLQSHAQGLQRTSNSAAALTLLGPKLQHAFLRNPNLKCIGAAAGAAH